MKSNVPAIVLIIVLAILCQFNSVAQPAYHHLNDQYKQRFNIYLESRNSGFHSSIKPYNQIEVEKAIPVDSLNKLWYGQPKSKLSGEHFITLKKDRFQLHADPLFNLTTGAGLTGKQDNLLETAIGSSVNGSIGDNIAFNLDILSGNTAFPGYLDDYIAKNEVVPGRGPAYKTDLGYAWYLPSYYLSWQPGKYFNLQIGRGKHFLGNGYRSLLLSQNSHSYPYLKLSTNIWKFKYVNLFGNFKDIRGVEGLSDPVLNKFGAFHYLSWDIGRVNIAFFEGIIWQDRDSTGVRGLDINYLNPVIFYRPVEFSQDSPDNALMGFNMNIKLFGNHLFYMQIVLDEFYFQEIRKLDGWSNNKQGLQLGYKIFEPFNFKGLIAQSELNYVRPYTYTHNTPAQNYANYNEPLAHPFGANFLESVSRLSYFKGSWLISGKLIYAKYGEEEEGRYVGKDIFKNYHEAENLYGNYVGQGNKTNLLFAELKTSYLLNPKNNLRLEAGIMARHLKSETNSSKTTIFTLGVRTTINNYYEDF